MVDVNGVDLFRLGRKLMKLGIESFPASGFQSLPSSYRMVLTDVFENPDSSISEITARTGFPQSHVSAAVAKFRDAGVFVTTVDPADRRRTLVRRSPEHAAKAVHVVAPVEPVLGRALGENDFRMFEALDALEMLAGLLLAQPAGTAVTTAVNTPVTTPQPVGS